MASPSLLITCSNAHYTANYLQGIDTLSKQTEYTVIVDTLDIAPLQQGLGQTVNINFVASDGKARALNTTLLAIEDNGVIGANSSVTATINNTLKRRYTLTLGSRLSLLNSTQHSRVFIDTNLTDILSLVLADAGYHHAQITFNLANATPILAQCVQAIESNLAFFNRLLRQYGLFYWFDSIGDSTGIIISDNNQSSPYLERGLLQVHHGVGFNAQLSADQLISSVTQGFVGFTQCEYSTNQGLGLASAMSDEYRLTGDNLAAHNFAQPVSATIAQANAVAQHQSQALNRFEQVITLTGNVPDVFAGCSFSLHDDSGINASGDYLCISVEHYCQQPSDETSQDGLAKYHCVVTAIPRSQPFKLPFEEFPPLPTVFSAKVEAISASPTLNDRGEYFTKLGFDETAKAPLTSMQPLRKLVNYACANQPQATGWHFPLANDAQVLLGCLNNDPAQAYIMGFDMNEEQPAVVNSKNSVHNRILSRAGHELRFDDDEKAPTIILQTLSGDNYIELNANTNGKHYIQWLSRLGSISLHAANELLFEAQGNIDVSVGGYQTLDAKDAISIESNASSLQSATHHHQTAKAITVESGKNTALLTGRSLKTTANSKIQLLAEQGDIAINVPQGSTIINANSNIRIEGTGRGDITLFNQGGMIKLDASGNVSLIGSDVLTLNGSSITFDGDVTYKNASPQTGANPSSPQPPNITPIADLGLSVHNSENTTSTSLALSYFDTNNQPIEDIRFEVLDVQGTLHTGLLSSGMATLDNLPIGQCEINYLGTTSAEEQKLIELRATFKQHLNAMLVEVRQKAAREDALFEQESLFTQWMIQTGAVMTGTYQGGKSLVEGVADLVTLAVDVNIQVYSACYDVMNSLARGDTQALKLQLETILAFSEKSMESLTQAFELLVIIIEDEETRTALAHFPSDYFNAHSFVEKHRIGGIFLFEILLAVLTSGIGTAVSAASKSKHVVKANKALIEIADIIELKRLNKQQTHALESNNTTAVAKIEKPKAELEAPKNDDKKQPQSRTAHIIKEKHGTNEAIWKVDEKGRPISVEAKLDSTYNTNRSQTEKNLQQTSGGKARLNDDDGGHVIGHRFMSDQGEKNLFPQNANLNRSGYKKMENEWADWTNAGFEVKLKVDLHPPGSDRPTDIISEYEVIDPVTGDIVFEREHRFNNVAGEEFERVAKSDIKSFRN